ncbi:hypothetical protein EYF80_013897 [Liparis tanakae]|uniref:Uncharacterized protein n=1 Tax=Liparis tanakae TaxID=230148 RepID=A0A4Z2IDE1_9TELE|nr:hypothetical protein EYF80_013897 [Liparis tanakae]
MCKDSVSFRAFRFYPARFGPHLIGYLSHDLISEAGIGKSSLDDVVPKQVLLNPVQRWRLTMSSTAERSLMRRRILQAEQGFVPVRSHNDNHPQQKKKDHNKERKTAFQKAVYLWNRHVWMYLREAALVFQYAQYPMRLSGDEVEAGLVEAEGLRLPLDLLPHIHFCFSVQLTVSLKVTAFCRPSGDTCSSSATTLISCALTTAATS